MNLRRTLQWIAGAVASVSVASIALQPAAPRPAAPQHEMPQPEAPLQATSGPTTDPTRVIPAALAEASTTQPDSLIRFELPAWRAGERGTITLARPANVSVFDTEGKIVWSVDAPAGEVTIAVDAPGYYRLEAAGTTGGKYRQTTNFAVVPAARPAVDHPQVMGINTHFGQRDMPDASYPLLKLMHVDAVRDEMGWGGVEPRPGVFEYLPRHHKYTGKLKENGIKLLFCAGYNNAKLYGEGRYPNVPAGVEPFGRYCAETLKQFGDNILAIEILNEPNKIDPVERYLPVLKSAHEQIRAAGIKTPIIAVGGAGAGGGMSPSYTSALFNAGGAAYCDAFSVHPYMTPFTPDSGYGENANADMAARRNADVMKKFDQAGVWMTEVGWPGPRPADDVAGDAATRPIGTRAMVPADKQAAFTARMLLIMSRHAAVKGTFIYDFQDDGHLPLRREHRFGLIRQDLTPKPGFLAFSVTADFLKGKTFVRRVGKPDGLLNANVYTDRAGDTWAAVWTQEVSNAQGLAHGKRTAPLPERYMDAQTERRFKATATPVGGHDWQGRPIAPAVEMTATNLPMFVHLGKNADATIEAVGDQ